jgi:hypothetical protein
MAARAMDRQADRTGRTYRAYDYTPERMRSPREPARAGFEPRGYGPDYDTGPLGRDYYEPAWRRENDEDRWRAGWGGYSGYYEPAWHGPGYGRAPFWWREPPWEHPGRGEGPSFTGRGPRGYRRSDERIMEDVCDRLSWHPDIDASDIDVRVENGEVTLEGTADTRREKRLAEDIAESVWGVVDVHNRLRLRPRVVPPYPAPATAGSWQLAEGMNVFGADGQHVGVVKEIRERDFLLDRPMQRDVYVPFAFIRDTDGDRVALMVRSDQIDQMGWANPPLAQAA